MKNSNTDAQIVLTMNKFYLQIIFCKKIVFTIMDEIIKKENIVHLVKNFADAVFLERFNEIIVNKIYGK